MIASCRIISSYDSQSKNANTIQALNPLPRNISVFLFFILHKNTIYAESNIVTVYDSVPLETDGKELFNLKFYIGANPGE